MNRNDLTIPDTLNLENRVKFSLNFLTKNTDSKKGYLPYFVTCFKHDPAEARHDWPDFGDLTGRYVNAFILARIMTGSDEGEEVEKDLKKLLLSYFNEGDGLCYRPQLRQPYYSTVSRCMYDSHVAEGFDQAKAMTGLLSWFLSTGEDRVKRYLDRMVEGLFRVGIKKDKCFYYSRPVYEPGYRPEEQEAPLPQIVYFGGVQIFPLVRYYQETGNEKALEIASGLTRYIVYGSHSFGEDGSFSGISDDCFGGGVMDGHTHSRLGTVAGILRYAGLVNNCELFKWGKMVYDWFVQNHCSSFGYSPEFIGRYGIANEGCETCTITDQLYCAILLAEGGYPEYWNDVERITRNQLIEQQLIDTHLIRSTVEKTDTEQSRFHNVAEMVIGGFAGWAAPNDFIGHSGHSWNLMNCCGPAGVHALYLAWSHIVTKDKDTVRVNLMLNRSTPWVDILSCRPYAGKIIFQIKESLGLQIRIPDWLDKSVIEMRVNNNNADFKYTKDYLEILALRAGDEVTITYPLRHLTENVPVNGRSYKITWKGDTVIDINPPGQYMPLYKRNHFCKDLSPMTNKKSQCSREKPLY